ncbi:hypothetical protein EF908_24080 [Streptomyces sp. WAC04770]|nr:hypothetical protein EF908_24080 [Streptomyces sp. WAC04770]
MVEHAPRRQRGHHPRGHPATGHLFDHPPQVVPRDHIDQPTQTAPVLITEHARALLSRSACSGPFPTRPGNRNGTATVRPPHPRHAEKRAPFTRSGEAAGALPPTTGPEPVTDRPPAPVSMATCSKPIR